MQQSHYPIEANGKKIKTLDADGDGQFIAMTEDGEVIAHDFRTTLKRASGYGVMEFQLPVIRRLNQEMFLIVNRHGYGRHHYNGRVYDLSGNEIASFPLGDEIQDVLVCKNKIVITYSDEAGYGHHEDDLCHNGLALFSLKGKLLFGFNDQLNRFSQGEEWRMIDCESIAAKNNDHIVFVPYGPSPTQIFEMALDDDQIVSKTIPEEMQGMRAVSCHHDVFIFHDVYPDKSHFYWWREGMAEVEIIPESFAKRTTGLTGGRFLTQNDDGYTIIDPLALSIKYARNFGSRRLELVLDDITNQHVDAIVNAANDQLAGGFGVDGAIHRRGGPSIMEETREKYPCGCPTGFAEPSFAGDLNAKYVFHAVGPRWFESPERFDLLQSAYVRCLELAIQYDCRSIAFPSISTGDFGYPLKESAVVAMQTVSRFLRTLEQTVPLEYVRFTLFSEKDLETYREALELE